MICGVHLGVEGGGEGGAVHPAQQALAPLSDAVLDWKVHTLAPKTSHCLTPALVKSFKSSKPGLCSV